MPETNYQWLFWVLGVGGGLISVLFLLIWKLHSNMGRWANKEAIERLKLGTTIAQMMTEIAKTYVTKDDYKENQKQIMSSLQRIEDSLNNKVDKK